MKNTVKIYKVTCEQGYQMSDQGKGFSLNPWGKNTIDYKGSDDGGQGYILPENFEVEETPYGQKYIVNTKTGEIIDRLFVKFNSPYLVTGNGEFMLKKLQKEENNMLFIINYNTGAGNETANSLEEAMKTADQNACYVQENITIEDEEDNVLASRTWWGSLDGVEECENPIRFGEFGYYGDWEIE